SRVSRVLSPASKLEAAETREMGASPTPRDSSMSAATSRPRPGNNQGSWSLRLADRPASSAIILAPLPVAGARRHAAGFQLPRPDLAPRRSRGRDESRSDAFPRRPLAGRGAEEWRAQGRPVLPLHD